MSGHILNDGTGSLIGTGDNGNLVYQILANYQMQANGGNGFMRLINIDPDLNIANVQSFSPHTGQLLLDPENNFAFENIAFSSSHLPSAVAGTDKILVDTIGTGIVNTLLDGSQSFDPNGSLVSFHWYNNDTFIGEGKIIPASLPVGPNYLTLTVTDNDGESDTDNLLITVSSAGAIYSTTYETLLNESFDDGDYFGWSIHDQGTVEGPSFWTVNSGIMTQTSNIFGPEVFAVANRQGTYALFDDNQAFSWDNYVFEATLNNTDNDGIGLLFRYQDSNNYYKIEFDNQRSFTKLFKIVKGEEITLASTNTSYTPNTNFTVRIEAVENYISLYLNGVVLFGGSIFEDSLPAGSIGLYCWGSQNALFDSIIIQQIDTASRSLFDQDGDMISDSADNCPHTANTSQTDSDSDGVGDLCDTFSNDPLEWTDTDHDGIGDNTDSCVKSYNPSQLDSDNDAKGDQCDEKPLIADYGSIVDAPHNQSRGILCADCHNYSLWFQFSPMTSAPQSAINSETICLQCHGAGPGAIFSTHSSTAMGSQHNQSFGEWSVGCVDCHDPHQQAQLSWRFNDSDALYLIKGEIDGNFNINKGITTFDYSLLYASPQWSDPSGWSQKNSFSPSRGLILVQDMVNAFNSFQIVAATNATISIKGGIDPGSVGSSFGIIYGQMIKSIVQTPIPETRNVRFFNPREPSGGYTDSRTPVSGICQICHQQTVVWDRFGVKKDTPAHSGFGNLLCTNCHLPSQGFAPE